MGMVWGNVVHKMLLALLVGVLVQAAVLIQVANHPWLGVEVERDPAVQGWPVVGVPGDSPAAGHVQVGEQIVALVGAQGTRLTVTPAMLVTEEADVHTRSAWNHLVADKEAVDTLLRGQTIAVVFEDGRQEHWATTVVGWRHIPFEVWFGAAMCVLVWGVSAGVLLSPGVAPQIRTLLVAIGVGFALIVAGYIHSSVPAYTPFGWMLLLNWLGTGVLGGGMIALVLVYPGRLVPLHWSYAPIPLFTLHFSPFMAQGVDNIAWVNQLFILGFCLALAVAATLQWRRSRRDPLRRAMVKWLLLSMVLATVTAVIMAFVPKWTGMGSGTGVTYAMLPIALMYVGFVLGIHRYRLFEVERWWLNTWLWVAGGVLVVVGDLALAAWLNLSATTSLALALLIAGWLWFPLRQHWWGRLLGDRPDQATQRVLPGLIDSIFASTGAPLAERWEGVWRRAFEPVVLEPMAEVVPQVTLASDGTTLLVPALDGAGGLKLGLPHGGHRLYSRQDVDLAGVLVGLGRQAAQVWQAREEGARAERGRIVRDLHDDVGAELATLQHRLRHTEHAERIEQTIRTLRAVTSTLHTQAAPLAEVAGGWRAEVVERCEAAGVALTWRQDQRLEGVFLSPHQALNLCRIVREAVSNALRHGHPANLWVDLGMDDGSLLFQVTDDGCGLAGGNGAQGRCGHGRLNMEQRATELGGGVEWQTSPEGGCRVVVKVALPGAMPG